MSIVTEVKVFVFTFKDRPFHVPKGWDVFHAEQEDGSLRVFARRGVHQEEPTPGSLEDYDRRVNAEAEH